MRYTELNYTIFMQILQVENCSIDSIMLKRGDVDSLDVTVVHALQNSVERFSCARGEHSFI